MIASALNLGLHIQQIIQYGFYAGIQQPIAIVSWACLFYFFLVFFVKQSGPRAGI
jgi:hypothetical protein